MHSFDVYSNESTCRKDECLGVEQVITCLNMFPSKNGISSDLIPAAIVLGSLNIDYNKLNIIFGSYEQVYIGTKNSTKQRTVGQIALRPENEKGIYYFIYLATRKQLHAFIWIELPTNDQVISRVNDLATKEKEPEITKGYPIFEWIPGIPITDNDDEIQSEEYEISSTYKDEHNDDITENGEEEERIEEDTY